MLSADTAAFCADSVLVSLSVTSSVGQFVLAGQCVGQSLGAGQCVGQSVIAGQYVGQSVRAG